jgi:hypothetical protein
MTPETALANLFLGFFRAQFSAFRGWRDNVNGKLILGCFLQIFYNWRRAWPGCKKNVKMKKGA